MKKIMRAFLVAIGAVALIPVIFVCPAGIIYGIYCVATIIGLPESAAFPVAVAGLFFIVFFVVAYIDEVRE